ncbi:MAG: secondary thiamine-phosphate synthase enzyme YjbQ [Candidatus Omnitrophica bacterium]|nr:secondary thiamine-phosphate synthase enzyme YjbQ [Candidatus Omnitrophota bacterium]
MSSTIPVTTHKKEEFINMTPRIQKEINVQGVQNGLCHLFIPHTTAAVTINENADPDVITDILHGLSTMVPNQGFKHREGNSPAHIRSSLFGVSLNVPIHNGELKLGIWQGVYFCEFDGPRDRQMWISLFPF